MKTVRFSAPAALELRRHSAVAKRIVRKIEGYAKTGAGDVVDMVGQPGFKRLRIGDYRAIFAESGDEITVLKVGPRGTVYE